MDTLDLGSLSEPQNASSKSPKILDNPELVGMVLKEASEYDRINYADQYYAIERS